MSFDGFPRQTLSFLRGLSNNNDKTWFEAHRAEYDQHYIGVAKSFISAIGPRLEKIAPEVQAIPKVNGSIFRINRDIRFSKDKTPYKDHLDLWFWEGERKGAISGFFLRITDRTVHIGVGAHGLQKDDLKAFRDAVVDPAKGKRLLAVDKKLARAGWPLQGTNYKKLPRGYEADGRTAELLLHNALWAGGEAKSPPELGSKSFLKWCTDRWRKLAPLQRWLVDDLRG